MSYGTGSGKSFPTREKTILDDVRFTLYGREPVEGGQKVPTMRLHANTKGDMLLDIYLNNSDDFRKSNIQVPLDYSYINVFFEMMRRAIADKEGSKHTLEIKSDIWFRDKESGKMVKSEKQASTTIVVGRDKNTGILFLGVIKEKMPSVRFFFDGKKNINYIINDNLVDDVTKSNIWATNWLRAMEVLTARVAADMWKEPEKKQNNQGGNGGYQKNNNYSGGNKGNGGGNNYSAPEPAEENFDDLW